MEREISRSAATFFAKESAKLRVHLDREGGLPVSALCRLLAVSQSGYYAVGRTRSAHARRDHDLAEKVAEAHLASRRRYGSPRVHAALRASGKRVARKQVARIVREIHLVARSRRRFQTTTDSKHAFPIAPNLLARDFTAKGPDEAWVTDIAFLWTAQGWLYLAAIIDRVGGARLEHVAPGDMDFGRTMAARASTRSRLPTRRSIVVVDPLSDRRTATRASRSRSGWAWRDGSPGTPPGTRPKNLACNHRISSYGGLVKHHEICGERSSRSIGVNATHRPSQLQRALVSAALLTSFTACRAPGTGLSALEVGRADPDHAVRADVPAGGTLFSVWTKIPDPGSNYPWSRGNMDVYVLSGPSWHMRCLVGNSSATSPTQASYNANSMIFADPAGTWAGDYSYYQADAKLTDATVRGWVWVAWQVVVDSDLVTARQWLKFGIDGAVFAAGESAPTFESLRAAIVTNGASPADASAWTPTDATHFQVGSDHGYLFHARIEARSTAPELVELEAIARSTAPDPSAWADYLFDWQDGAANLADQSGHGRDLQLAPGGALFPSRDAPIAARGL